MLRVDDLQYKGLKIIQNTEFPAFTEDSVLLANFMRTRVNESVIDFGCGTGIISILGQAKTGASFTGIDKQADLVDLANKSACMNNQPINFLHMDVGNVRDMFKAESFDAVVFNPPYYTEGDVGPDYRRAASRHADSSVLSRYFEKASYLLKNRGDVYFCYPADKMPESFCLMRKFHLEPKILQLVANKADNKPRLMLLKGKKNAGAGLIVEPVRTYGQIVPDKTCSDN